jgi:hypothetical protein
MTVSSLVAGLVLRPCRPLIRSTRVGAGGLPARGIRGRKAFAPLQLGLNRTILSDVELYKPYRLQRRRGDNLAQVGD